MKNISKIFLNSLMLLSCIAVLVNCDILKNSGCKDCPSHSKHSHANNSLKGETLLSINNAPAITTESFDEYWKMLIGDDPNAAAIASLYPNAKTDVFKNRLVPSQIILYWMKETKKNEAPAFKQKLKAMKEMIEAQLAEQAFQEEIIASIDTNDEVLRKFYEENKSVNPIFSQAPFITDAAGIKASSVKFTSEASAKDFVEKAKKNPSKFNELAKEAKKEVTDLGIVGAQSRLDFALKNKIDSMDANSIDFVSTGKNSFEVIKTGSKQEAKFANFDEVASSVKQAYIQIKGTEQFTQKIEELKKKYNVVENTSFFDKEKASKQAELEEQMKAMQKQEDESEDTPKADVSEEVTK